MFHKDTNSHHSRSFNRNVFHSVRDFFPVKPRATTIQYQLTLKKIIENEHLWDVSEGFELNKQASEYVGQFLSDSHWMK